ncbi:aldo/keto reductase [Crateriforma conspicua]|uniref:General stress protein 69 n=1 Tax=Crateriforma conspicua TaxID=2527996 RepID=A0A5C5Y0S2_9PLAN|nr:aldo/keto reductase [Crateriforma conspicua]TWT68558.1 General stress protein 69 [Crateriforma conspicua]
MSQRNLPTESDSRQSNTNPSDRCSRRSLLTATAALSAGTMHAGAAIGAESESPSAPIDDDVPPPRQIQLGNTGITMSRVGQGTGMHGGNRQSDHTRQGFEKLVALLNHAYDRGVTFFDLADLYGSHVYFREALRTIPRDKVTVLSKLWTRYDGPFEKIAPSHRKQAAKTTIERFCHEIATDHLDILLLHCMTTPDWSEQLQPYMEAFDEAKKSGKLRAVGVSCHNLEALKIASQSDWVDVILARINPHGAKMDGKVDDVVSVLTEARKNGKAIIGMKIYGEGTLADKADECIRFAQSNGLLDTMTVGAETPEQMDQTLRLIAKYPAAPLITP